MKSYRFARLAKPAARIPQPHRTRGGCAALLPSQPGLQVNFLHPTPPAATAHHLSYAADCGAKPEERVRAQHAVVILRTYIHISKPPDYLASPVNAAAPPRNNNPAGQMFSRSRSLHNGSPDGLGLDLLFPPAGTSDEDAMVDIVFVHGLGGSRYGTWAKDGVLWPRTVLALDFPTARILTVGGRELAVDCAGVR